MKKKILIVIMLVFCTFMIAKLNVEAGGGVCSFYQENYVIPDKEVTIKMNNKDIIWKYAVLNDEIVALTCANPEDLEGDIVLPNEIDGKKVVSIGDIKDAPKLTGLTLSENIIYLLGSISYNENLSYIDLKNLQVAIGGWEFGSCPKLKKIVVPKNFEIKCNAGAATAFSSVEEITYEYGTVNVYEGSINAKKLNIPDTVKNFIWSGGVGEFFGTEIVFPKSVENVEFSLWTVDGSNFKNLEKLTFYNKNTNIDISALDQFENKENLTIYCYKDSTAETFAKQNSIKVEYLEDVVLPTYEILDNTNNQKIDLNSSYKVRIDADINTISNLIYIDNILVNPKYYTITSGSTIIDVSKEYIKTLPTGEHKLSAQYNDGTLVTTTFEVVEKLLNEEKTNTVDKVLKEKNPDTADNILNIVLIMSISFITLIICLKRNNKVKSN